METPSTNEGDDIGDDGDAEHTAQHLLMSLYGRSSHEVELLLEKEQFPSALKVQAVLVREDTMP